jgi:Na+-driven multidrug efflux pump
MPMVKAPEIYVPSPIQGTIVTNSSPARTVAMKFLIILMLVAIFASLFMALFSLFRSPSGSTRTVKALTCRISLSIGLFILLIVGHFLGWIHRGG